MSRSGYTDDDDDGRRGLWRGAVASSLRGKRGQAALHDLAQAMDTMPVKALAAESLVNASGELCTLGVLGQSRGMDVSQFDPDDWAAVAKAFGLSQAMVREIVYLNDERYTPYEWERIEVFGPIRHYNDRAPWQRVDHDDPGARRWQYMRKWVAEWTQSQAVAQ